MTKIILLVLGLLFASGGYLYYQNQTIVESQPAVFGETSELKQANATPTPKEPSEKALKIASFLVVRLSDKQLPDSKTNFGDKNMTNAELIRLVALDMDLNPSYMAEQEALMNRISTEENSQVNQPIYYYGEESVGDTNETLCQKQTIKYQECMNEYTLELGRYTECVERGSGFCLSPTNFCQKPRCVQ